MAFSRLELERIVADAAVRHSINPAVAYWQIQAESNFNPNAQSWAGASGIAQFMPATAAQYGLANRLDPVASMEAWGRYMGDLLRMFPGDYAKALAGYNWGQGRVQSAVSRYGADWLAHAPTETRNYVAKILGNAAGGAAPPPVDPGAGDPGGAPFDPADWFDTDPNAGDGSIIPMLSVAVALLLVYLLVSD